MINLPEDSNQPSAGQVGDNDAALASKFNGALPTCAPNAFICLTRAELNARWPEGIRGFQPREVWQGICKWLALSQTNPALN